MNVLHLYTNLNITCGISKTIFNIIQETKTDINHYIICFGGDGIKKFGDHQIPVYVIKNWKFLPGVILVLVKFCRTNEIAIIHSHHRICDLIAYFVSFFINLKTVTSVQSKVYGKKRLSYKADFLIAAGNNIKKHLINCFTKDEKKIFVINNFVSQKEFETQNQHIEQETDCNKKIICFIGRFSKEKGVDVLLKAFKLVEKKISNVKLILVGNGELQGETRNYIETEKLNAVIYPPQLNVADFYKSADVIVLPSRVDPFPLTMLEAGFMKSPFVGCKVDGIEEFIEHGINGLLCNPGNETDLSDILIESLTDGYKAKLRAENLYRKVINGFTEEKIIPAYISLYKQILKK